MESIRPGRRPTIDAGTDLDELRRSAAALGSANSLDAPEIEPLLKNEQVIATSLQTNEKGLRRSQGDSWYSAMSDDLAQLMATRQSILDLNAPLRSGSGELTQEAVSLAALVPRQVEARIPVPSKVKRGSDDKGARLATSASTSVMPSPALVAPPVIETHSVTTRAPLSMPPDYTLTPPRPGALKRLGFAVKQRQQDRHRHRHLT